MKRSIVGAFVLSLAVASFVRPAGAVTYGPALSEPVVSVPATLTAQNQVLFAGRSLSRLTPVNGVLTGFGTVTLPPYYVKRGAGWMTMEFQAANDIYIKGVKVRLEQSGDDIVGRIERAFYIERQQEDTYALYPGRYSCDQYLVSGVHTGGYGANSITVRFAETESEPIVVTTALTEPVTVGPFADVTLRGEAAASATNAAFVVTDARLKVEVEDGWTFGPETTFAGTNGVVVMDGKVPEVGEGIVVDGVPPPIINGGSWASSVAAQDRHFADFVGMEDTLFLENGGKQGACIVVTTNRTENAVTYQVHRDAGDWLKIVFIRFYDAPDGVRTVITRAGHAQRSNYGHDMTDQTLLSENATYGIASFKMRFSRDDKTPSASVSANNAMVTSSFVAGTNCNVVVTADSAYPVSGELAAERGGTLTLDASRPHYVGVTGRSNGSVVVKKSASTVLAPTLADGGVVDLARQGEHYASKRDGGTYWRNLIHRDGGSIVGSRVRVANGHRVTVEGSGAVTNDVGYYNCWHKNATGVGMIFEIADTTNDERPDFVLTANWVNYSADYYGLPITKRGAGTMLHTGAFQSDCAMPIIVEDGEFRVGPNALTAVNDLTLKGGVFAAPDGSAVTAGTLTLSGDAELRLGTGTTIAFKASDAKAWTSGKWLNIVGDFRTGSVRFGTDKSGLTAAQVRRVRANGIALAINGEGYLVPRCLTIIIR